MDVRNRGLRLVGMYTEKQIRYNRVTEDFQGIGDSAVELINRLDTWAGEAEELLSDKDYWVLWRAIDVLQRVRAKHASKFETPTCFERLD
jgi:hypothetical protein